MVQNPPEGMQRIAPSLTYEDAPAAIEFLCRAFGFEETMRMPMPDGRIGHAELAMYGNTLMLASAFEEVNAGSPKHLPHLHASVDVYVDDVDAHYERAKAEGAEIIQEPEEMFWGDRVYRALDPEGQRWMFHTKIRDVSHEEMQAAMQDGG